MIKHVILWKIKPEYSPEQKEEIKRNAKNELEGLVGKIPGLKNLTVQIHPLPSSNADLMLDSLLESREALSGYAVHPDHVSIADHFVRPFMEVRLCMDYEEEA